MAGVRINELPADTVADPGDLVPIFDSATGKTKRVTVALLLAAAQALDSDLTDIGALTPADDDVMQRKAGHWANRTIAQLKTDLAITGGGDTSTNTSVSVDGEAVLFSGTGGKTLKRSTLTGIIKQTSGVPSAATEGTDYYKPGATDVAVADGGTGASTAAGARTNLGLVIGTDVLAPAGNGSALTGITESQVTNLTTDLAAKAPLASPALTGSPTAPTQSAGDNSTKIATTAYVDAIIAAQDAMVFKGVIDCSANPNYPAADRGHTYRVSVAGKIGGASGTNVEAGDILLCLTDSTAAGNQATVGTAWSIIQANLDGALLTTAIGVTVQAYDAELAALAGLTSAADKLPYFTGAGAAALADFTAAGRALVDDASAAAQRTTLGVGTADSPQFTAIELGAASDTTVSRSAAGVMAVEGVVIPSISSTNTLTNKRVTKRTGTTASSATPTINTDNVDFYSITALAAAITSMTTNLSGTPTDGQVLWLAITDNGTARAITWGTSFEASGNVALPTTTVISTRLDVGFVWNAATSKWRCVAVA